jgi:hypothetical protein
MPTEEKLTDEQAEAMLKMLARHFREPVLPMSRYCDALNTWGRVVGERAATLRKELFPNYHDWEEVADDRGQRGRTPLAKEQHAEYEKVKTRDTLRSLILVGLSALSRETAKEVLELVHKDPDPRERQIIKLLSFEEADHQVERTFLAIHKSNLLARILYAGEKLRSQACPEHKGKWSGIEWPENPCPHKCQMTGWVQEPDDQGKPLPGVQVVKTVDIDGVQIIIGPNGEQLGKVTPMKSV